MSCYEKVGWSILEDATNEVRDAVSHGLEQGYLKEEEHVAMLPTKQP